MFKRMLLTGLLLIIFVGIVGATPIIDIGPNGSLAVKLEVSDVIGSSSIIQMIFDTPIDITLHPIVTVSFDMYRSSTGGHQYMDWFFTHNPELSPRGGLDAYGEPGNYRIIPLRDSTLAYDSYWVSTVSDRYANITMLWNFINNTTSAYYDGNIVVDNVVMLENNVTHLYGWLIRLTTLNYVSEGSDIVWIDNFVSPTYNSYGFDSFTSGVLDGQDGWIGVSNNPTSIPEPSTVILLIIGGCILGLRKKFFSAGKEIYYG